MNGKRVSVSRALAMPVLRFLWLYVWCGLWRSGKHGLFYSLSCACREIMREAKLWETHEVKPLPHPPVHTYAADASQTSRRVRVKTDLAEGRSP